MVRSRTMQPAASMKRWLPLLVLLGLLLSACDLGGSNPPGTPTAIATVGLSDIQTLPTLTVVAPPTVSGTANTLQVAQVTQYKNTLGGFTVIGLVRNAGSTPLIDLKISATAKDAGGATVGTGDDQFLPLVVTLPPGAGAPFSITFSGLTGEPATADVQAAGTPYQAQGALYPPANGLTVSGMQLAKASAGSGNLLTGRVKNGGTATAATVRILGVAYDAQGLVVDVGKGAADPETLAPGADAPFQVKFRRDDVQIAKYDALAVGLEKK
jgi:hypothetical protein